MALKKIYRFVGGLCIGYLLGAVIIFFIQRNLIYLPPAHAPLPGDIKFPQAEVVTLNLPDGEHRFWSVNANPDAPTVMFFHGNSSNIANKGRIYHKLYQSGYNVVAVEYPEYYGNPGKLSQTSVTEAAIAQYDWAVAQGARPEAIMLYGNSLGAAVASQVAAKRDVAIVVVEAPFDSLTNRANMQFPLYPARILLRDKWDNVAALNAQSAPVIWIHGTADQTVPLTYGQSLYDQLIIPKSAHIINGGGHSDLWKMGTQPIIFDALSRLPGAPSKPIQSPAIGSALSRADVKLETQ